MQQPGPWGAPPPAQSASTQAIVALVLALLGFFMCGCFTSIPAIFVARAELKAIDAGHSPPAGRAIAQVAFWIGLIHSILLIVGLGVYAILVVFGLVGAIAFG